MPGVTILTRLVARVRDRASLRLWRVLAALPNVDQRSRLEALLVVGDGDRVSPLDQLRRAPTRISSPAMVDALNRLTEIRSLGVSHLDMARLPSGRIKALARYAATAWAAGASPRAWMVCVPRIFGTVWSVAHPGRGSAGLRIFPVGAPAGASPFLKRVQARGSDYFDLGSLQGIRL